VRRRRFPLAAVAAVASTVGCSDNAPDDADVKAITTDLGRRTVVISNVALTPDEAATFEQIHPVPGVSTLSTTATVPLLACPGGRGGIAVRSGRGSWGSTWVGEDCIRLDGSAPATLPSVSTADQHYAIAVRRPDR
jgi:hypothetical protein